MQISADYIRGLVDGEGCFTFCNTPKNKYGKKLKLPTFVIQMHERDKELIEKIKEYLGVKDRIYICKAYLLDGYKRGKTARLMVRDFGELRDIIIPFFYKKLIGHKRKQFFDWLENDLGFVNCTSEFYKREIQTVFTRNIRHPYQNDYIFISPSLKNKLGKCDVPKRTEVEGLSDHSPVIVELNI